MEDKQRSLIHIGDISEAIGSDLELVIDQAIHYGYHIISKVMTSVQSFFYILVK